MSLTPAENVFPAPVRSQLHAHKSICSGFLLISSQAGEDQYCESGKRNPGFNADGFLAEYAIVDSLFSVKIPEKLPLEK